MIRSLFPLYNTGKAISHICISLCEHLEGGHQPIEVWVPASDAGLSWPFVHNACPRWALPFIYHLPNPEKRLIRAVERAFLRALRPGDIAYLWPGVSLEIYQRIKDRGNTIIVERINCHTRYAKRVLDNEYARIGWRESHGITELEVEKELKEMSLADLIYAPSTLVAESLQESGVSREKILPASYGWEPDRMKGTDCLLRKEEGLTALFVGRLCVRKGIHLLLEAWERANIKGRLLLAGAMDADVARKLANHLARKDVIHLGYTEDVGAVYRSADVFVFGSLEEGSPLVSYEAMGCGLPMLVSPMGAGPARDGVEGYVIDPHDIDGWASALRRFADDPELLNRMGAAARTRADDFTWEKVALRRRKILEEALEARNQRRIIG